MKHVSSGLYRIQQVNAFVISIGTYWHVGRDHILIDIRKKKYVLCSHIECAILS